MSKPFEVDAFERRFGQRICVHLAQGCIARIKQSPTATSSDLSIKETLGRILGACRDVYQEVENEAEERPNDACS